jgi:hypothetical protein
MFDMTTTEYQIEKAVPLRYDKRLVDTIKASLLEMNYLQKHSK